MSKILGIGLSKTGTSSLALALDRLGYRTVHFPQSLAEIDAADAATDVSVAFIYKELDRLYPGSRFILTLRPEEAWLASCAWHFRDRARLDRYDERMRQLAILARTTLYDGVDFEAERFARCYRRHLDDVTRHFADRGGDLLLVDLCSAPRWEPLCSFLGRPVPREPFPWSNRRSGVDQIPAPPRRTLKAALQRALRVLR